jgi:hypothetical protein
MNMLQGKPVDRIPFTCYENKIYTGKDERELRNDGFCIVQRAPNFFKTSTPNCPVKIEHRTVNGRLEIHTTVETEAGVLTSGDVDRGGGTHNAWHEKLFFEDESDYPALKAYLEDLTYTENFAAVRRKMEEGQGDLFMRGKLGYSPMHDIIYTYMGIETFCYEWADNRDKILELYEVLVQKRRDLCRIAKDAPQLAINICGNVTANVVSPKMFEEFYLPVYNETCEMLHEGGRLCGVHFDGITLPYADLIRQSKLDYIEALTPPPTCDMTVAQAHELWPDKAIWINFPSSVHLESPEKIRAAAKQILAECKPEQRFLMGITEDVPGDCWPRSFRIILDECNAFSLVEAE